MFFEFHIATLTLVACLVSYLSFVWGWNSCLEEYTQEIEEGEEDDENSQDAS